MNEIIVLLMKHVKQEGSTVLRGGIFWEAVERSF